jgi:sodium/proline symporter
MELTKILFNPWVVGNLSCNFICVMSTLSCQLLVCSSALTEDLYKGLIRKNASQKELVWIGRAMVLAVALLALLSSKP